MRPLILAVAILFAPLTARAMSISQAEHEAHSFLTPCHYKTRQLLCKITQFDFVEEYVMALSGDYSAQGSTMSSFSIVDRICPHCEGSLSIGDPANQVLACAWAMLLVFEPKSSDPNSTNARPNARSECTPLTHRGLIVATRAAIALRLRIQEHPVHLPANWMPSSAGVFPPRLTPCPTASAA